LFLFFVSLVYIPKGKSGFALLVGIIGYLGWGIRLYRQSVDEDLAILAELGEGLVPSAAS